MIGFLSGSESRVFHGGLKLFLGILARDKLSFGAAPEFCVFLMLGWLDRFRDGVLTALNDFWNEVHVRYQHFATQDPNYKYPREDEND